MSGFSKGVTVALIFCTACWHLLAAEPSPPGSEGNAPNRKSDERPPEWKLFSDYRDWKPTTDEPFVLPPNFSADCRAVQSITDGHEAGFGVVYVNAVGRQQYLSSEPGRFPEGTVIVKEKLRTKDSTKPQELGVMIKREKGFAPEAGDWQYLFVDGYDQQLTTSQAEFSGCINCHKQQAEKDHVFRHSPAKLAKGYPY